MPATFSLTLLNCRVQNFWPKNISFWKVIKQREREMIVLVAWRMCEYAKTTAQTILFSYDGHTQCTGLSQPHTRNTFTHITKMKTRRGKCTKSISYHVMKSLNMNVISFQLKNASQALFLSMALGSWSNFSYFMSECVKHFLLLFFTIDLRLGAPNPFVESIQTYVTMELAPPLISFIRCVCFKRYR